MRIGESAILRLTGVELVSGGFDASMTVTVMG
jgi:hypothetical protein